VEAVRNSGGTINIFSVKHVSGNQLQQVSGVAVILRFPLYDVDDSESSSSCDSDNDSDSDSSDHSDDADADEKALKQLQKQAALMDEGWGASTNGGEGDQSRAEKIQDEMISMNFKDTQLVQEEEDDIDRDIHF
jgi:hypothetical protein|tara:strand:+ start:249 stop:650 length:402 start_codon:yes stop_codon:yes gene_type:complete